MKSELQNVLETDMFIDAYGTLIESLSEDSEGITFGKALVSGRTRKYLPNGVLIPEGESITAYREKYSAVTDITKEQSSVTGDLYVVFSTDEGAIDRLLYKTYEQQQDEGVQHVRF